MNPPAIEISNVSFSYLTPRKEPFIKGFPFPIKRVINERKMALEGINLNIQKDKITALLGRNGSGKTTLIRLISGTRSPDTGVIRILGEAPKTVRHRMGVCFGNSLIYNRLTGRENLEYYARLYNVENYEKKIHQLTEMLEIEGQLDQMVESFSFGMKAKLAIARSLIHSPEILILDEPTLGIDLHLATHLRQFIRELKCTVLLTTHYMEEAQQLADDLCLINKGKIHDMGPRDVILDKYHTRGVAEAFLQATGA